MKMSPAIGQLAEALSKAQGAMRGAEKDRDNPFFKSSYATLASVIEAIREPFAANKLAFMQPTRVEADGSMTVETIVMHASGEWISGEATAKPVKTDPQGIGSLISYLKRYGLQAMAGVASRDDDDDANHASGKVESGKAQASQQVTKVVETYTGTDDQKKNLKAQFAAAKVPESIWPEIDKRLRGRPANDWRKAWEESKTAQGAFS